MSEFFMQGEFWAPAITVGAFLLGRACYQKWKLAVFNPILLAAVLVGALLVVLKMPVERYQSGCAQLSFWLTPATAMNSPKLS